MKQTFATLSVVLSTIASATSWGCNASIPAVMPGISYYTNATGAGDTVDAELFLKHQRAMRPLDDFILSASDALDVPIPWSDAPRITRECVTQTLIRAAAQDALLGTPPNSGSRVGRAHYAAAFNLIAAKLKFRGQTLPPTVVDWLRKLTLAVINDYRNFRFHGLYNNVNARTGAVASTYLVLAPFGTPSPDNAAIEEYEEEAWQLSMNGIQGAGPSAGLIPGEMTRGKYAMMYSLHYYTALLLHREGRRARGIADQSAEWVRLRLFATTFAPYYCGSATEFFNLAGVTLSSSEEAAHKVSLAGFAFRTIHSLLEGTVKNEMFEGCLTNPVSNGYMDKSLGGDTRYIRPALQSLSSGAP